MVTASKISTWFLWGIVYSFFGWVYEVILWFLDMGYWDNRGFLYGPLCPIYGTSAVLALAILYKRTKNVVLLFLTGVVLTTGVEYIVSIVLEAFFGLRWWDYSQYRFNIQGRVSLLGAVVFGALIVLLVKLIHPRIEVITNRIADKTKIITAFVFAGVIVLDICMTVIHLLAAHQ